jgi:hypothetical protein
MSISPVVDHHHVVETPTPGVGEEDVRRIVREEIERTFRTDPATKRAAIIASRGTLDWACIDGVEFAGAGAFLSGARKSHVTLFV